MNTRILSSSYYSIALGVSPRSIRWSIIIPVFLVLMGCEDLLPEYNRPENIFEARLATTDSSIVEFREPANGSGGAIATYPVSYVTFAVVNTYEETFQYQVDPKGTLEIWIPNNRSANSVVSFSSAEIISSGAYNAATNVLTLNPGQSIFFKIRIDPKLASGFYLHKYAKEKTITQFLTMYYISILYEPLALMGRFNVQLAPDLPAVTVESQFYINLKGRFPFSP